MNEQPTKCSTHGCEEPGYLPLIGSARLCLVHWLRSRVRESLVSHDLVA